MVESKTVNFKTWCLEGGHGVATQEGRVGTQGSPVRDLKKKESQSYSCVEHTISVTVSVLASVLARVGRSAEGSAALGAQVLKAGCCFL